MFSNKRKRTLSKNGEELFSIAIDHKKFFLTKKNSWDVTPSPKNIKKRRHTISCLPLNPKKIFMNLISTDFDKKIEENSKNMKSASKKLLLHLYQNPEKIPEFVNNAVTNLVILILSDGEKYLNVQQVKHNVHFYLKLAERAIKEDDHQTAILIKCAVENYNIYRLRLKMNNTDKKILDQLSKKYGTFKNCYSNHLHEFIKTVKDYNNIYTYIPSAMVLHMHSIRNETYAKAFRRIGKCPNKISDYTNTIELFKKLFYNKNLTKKKDFNLTKLYVNIPNTLNIIQKFQTENQTENKHIDIKSLLFHLSCNVKKSKQNVNSKIIQNKKSSNCRIFLN